MADKHPVPESSKGDIAHAAARAVLSAVPWVGGALVELFQAVVQPPLDKRRNHWMMSVGEDLEKLEKEGVKIEDLQSNEQFISAVMHASNIALRTHQEEKLQALRNALQNMAMGRSPEETRQHVFLELIDSFSVMHFQILRVFQSPPVMEHLMAGGLSQVLEHAIPALRSQRELYDHIWNDLYAKRLVSTEGLHTTMSGQGLSQKRTTTLGDQLLKFITSPFERQEARE